MKCPKCEYEMIQHSLRKGSANTDKRNFELWRLGMMTTEECLDRFIKNNNIKQVVASQLDTRIFTDWLNSIGWRQKK